MTQQNITEKYDFLVDSHCHLNYPGVFEQLDQVLPAAKENNVKILQTICTEHEDIPTILDLIEKYSNVYGSIGLHPNNVAKNKPEMSLEFLLEQAKHSKIIGIGETGLDYFKKNSIEQDYKLLQQKSFINHILAAQINDLGLIIHSRDAEDDTFNLLKEYKHKKNFNAILHCFTGSLDFAKKLLDLDCFISFSGIITFKNASSLQEVVKFVPIEKILIETDSPYLSPMSHRGQTNQPSYVIHVAKAVAELKNLSIEEVTFNTTKNFFTSFNNSNKINLPSKQIDIF